METPLKVTTPQELVGPVKIGKEHIDPVQEGAAPKPPVVTVSTWERLRLYVEGYLQSKGLEMLTGPLQTITLGSTWAKLGIAVALLIIAYFTMR